MEKKKSKKQKKKEERKKIMKKYESEFTTEEWTEIMNFYDDGYSRRWFYHDWVKAGKPKK